MKSNYSTPISTETIIPVVQKMDYYTNFSTTTGYSNYGNQNVIFLTKRK